MDFERLVEVLRAFEREGVQYAIFGAVALNLHGLARFTEDLDLFVRPDTDNIDRVKRALMSLFADPEIDKITAGDLLGPYPAVQYVPPEGTFHLDLVTRLGSPFTFDGLETMRVAIGDLWVTAATPRMLYRMKRDTVRLKDRADAELLKERFKLED